MDISLRSAVIEERDRDDNGRLTRWKTGRRFVYIVVPKSPLPRTADIGTFTASLYHKEQKVAKCNKCLEKGHYASVCPNPIKCTQCYKEGHKKGDEKCELAAPMPEQIPKGTGNSEAKGKPTVQTSLPFAPASADKSVRRERSRSCMSSKRARSLSASSPNSARSPRENSAKRERTTSAGTSGTTQPAKSQTPAQPTDQSKASDGYTRSSREREKTDEPE